MISRPFSAESTDLAQKKVLVISFARKGAPLQDVMTSVLETVLTGGFAGRIDFYDELIDTIRFPPTYHSALADFLQQKYAGMRFDLIILIGGAAVDLIDRYADKSFPGVPVVFMGGGESAPEELRARISCAGIVTTLDHKNTIDLALQLQPGVNQVFVVSGESEFDKSYLSHFRQQTRDLAGPVTFNYLNGMSLEELQKRVASLPEDSIV